MEKLLSYDLYNNSYIRIEHNIYLCMIKHCKNHFLHVVHTGETIVSLHLLRNEYLNT